MPVIELGDLGSPPAGPLPRARSPFRARPGLAALLLLVTLAGLGAAAPPAKPLVRQLWTAGLEDSDGITFTGDALYLARKTEIIAYDLATGSVRWRRERPADAEQLSSFVAADGMVQLGGPPAYAPVPGRVGSAMAYPAALIVLDAATGAERWRTPGEVVRSDPDEVLVADRDDHGELHALRMVGARDGVARWEQPLTGTLDARMSGSLIVTTTLAGDIGTYRATDGKPLVRRHLDGSDDRLNTTLMITGERLLVTRTDPRGATITAYRLDDLTALWNRRALKTSYLTDCGPVLCLSEGAEVTGLDPASGAAQWRLTGRGGVNVAGPGRLLAYSTADQPTQVVVDAATGRVLGSPRRGWPVAASGPPVLLRAGTGDPARSVISRVDPVSGRITTIGTLPTPGDLPCYASGRFLLCRRPDGLVVTALG